MILNNINVINKRCLISNIYSFNLKRIKTSAVIRDLD